MAILFQSPPGSGRGWRDEFDIGPDRNLLGLSASGSALAGQGSGRAELDGTQLLASLDPGGLLLPAFITARLTGVAPEARIAVAVNGRIRAVAHSYDDGGEIRVGAMVAPSTFRAGANRVDLYEVVGNSGSANRLRSIGRSGRSVAGARLVEHEGTTVIQRDGKPDIEVVDGATTGFVDRVRAEGGSIEVIGWATDSDHRRVADEVLVFGDGRLIAAGRPTLERSDVALNFKQPGIAISGFQLTGASAEATEVASPERLRVIAVEGARAFDLPVEAGSFRVG